MATKLFFWILLAYGMSTIVVYGSIFATPRNWIKTHSKFFGELISCMLCTSTWCGFVLSLTLGSVSMQIFPTVFPLNVLLDGIFTAGGVWALNGIIEFFEENRFHK